MNLDSLKESYEELKNPPRDADRKWYQKRGYRFEKLLNTMLERDGLSPRTSYKPKGEQIDGSFIFDGRVLLMEAKWQDKQAPASTIYQFKGKVEGKLIGTIGVFISMSGYTSECVDALVLGKSLNVLLLDGDDIELSVSEVGAFKNLLRMRLREAAETGSVYRSSSPTDLEVAPYLAFLGSEDEPIKKVAAVPEGSGRITILCEGRFDAFILKDLAFRILKEQNLIAEIDVVQAGGKQNLPRVANLFVNADRTTTVIVVADTDNNPEATHKLVREAIFLDRFFIIMPSPSIESWLLKGDKAAAAVTRARQLTEGIRRSTRKAEEQLDDLDMEQLKSEDAEFASFYDIVKKAGKTPKSNSADAKSSAAD